MTPETDGWRRRTFTCRHCEATMLGRELVGIAGAGAAAGPASRIELDCPCCGERVAMVSEAPREARLPGAGRERAGGSEGEGEGEGQGPGPGGDADVAESVRLLARVAARARATQRRENAGAPPPAPPVPPAPPPHRVPATQEPVMTEFAPLLDALSFAAHKHRDQRRKDAEASPYINHPIALAQLLARTGGVTDVEVLMAAVLHDTVEDTDTTAEELRDTFGERVAALVMEVTDDKALPAPRRKELQVEHAPHLSEGAALIKLADKTCNLRDVASSPPAGWSIGRQQAYFDWAMRVVAGLPRVNAALEAAFREACAGRPADPPVDPEARAD